MGKTILLFFTVALIALCNIHVQSDISGSEAKIKDPRVDSIINNSSFIFEGKLVKIGQEIYDEKTGTYFRSSLFEVEKVYKGGEKVKEGTIEVISRHPSDISDPNRPIAFGYDTWYLLFCKEIDIKGVLDASNNTKVELFYTNYRFFSRFREFYKVKKNGELKSINPFYWGLGITFNTKFGVHRFLKDYGLSPEKPGKSLHPPVVKTPEKSPHYQTKEEKKEFIKMLKQQKRRYDSISKQNEKRNQGNL